VRLQFRGIPENERTAFLFSKVSDSNGKLYDIPVLIAALAGSPQIYALGLQCEVDEIADRLANAILTPIEPEIVKSGSVYEEIHIGDGLMEDGGLNEFPIPIATPGYDPAPYITAPYVVTKDPDNGIHNVGMYRAMVKSPLSTGINFATQRRGGYQHYRKYQKRGEPLPAAIVIGGPPSLGYVSVSPFPIDVNEYAVAGGIAKEPLELVKCKTIDLEVPANAEIVLEGEISTSQLEPEAPFGEATGYVGLMDMNPFFTIKCIAHRRQPIWLSTFSQFRPSESSVISGYAQESAIFQQLRHNLNMSHVLSVGQCGVIAIKVKRCSSELIWQTLKATLRLLSFGKIVVAVDDDINVRDYYSVLHAINTRAQPHRDFRIEQFTARHLGDYSLAPLEELNKLEPTTEMNRPVASTLLVDATRKWSYPPVSLPPKKYMVEALKIWQNQGLPKLDLQEPWWGINLGYWTEENKRYAKAVVEGKHFSAGSDYRNRRRYIQKK